MKQNRIIVFTRYPEAGRCKTRLIPLLGAEGAAELQRRMASLMIRTAREYASQSPDIHIEVRYDGGTLALMKDAFGKADYQPQPEGSLGQRMSKSFENAFSEGAEAVLITGSDCPDISPDLLGEAFARLRRHDLVIGPALDGGYYLIGMKRTHHGLFPADMPWGTASVLGRTLRIARKLGLAVSLLRELEDVDLPEDVARIFGHPLMEGLLPPRSDMNRISVIIPVLNEAETITQCLGPLTRTPGTFEVIVVDGGSVDGTVDLVRGVSGARLILSDRPGRAAQMNAGARAASGDVLLFLHADTRLPEDAAALILRSLEDPRVAGGRFRLRLSGARFVYFWIGLLSTWRSRFLNVTYGDQAIYARRAAFERVGGFPDLPLFEDAEFCAKISRAGRFVMLRADAVTSARRWERGGVLRTILLMWMLKFLHSLSVSPERLARRYRNVR